MSWPFLFDFMSLRQFVLITREMCLVQQTVWIRYSTEKPLGQKNRMDQNPIVIWGEKGRVGDSHLKRARYPSYIFGFKKAVFVSLRVLTLKGPQQKLLWYLSRHQANLKKYGRRHCLVLELVP